MKLYTAAFNPRGGASNETPIITPTSLDRFRDSAANPFNYVLNHRLDSFLILIQNLVVVALEDLQEKTKQTTKQY